MAADAVAGLLLTGGESRRFGSDKARLVLTPGEPSLAVRLAGELAVVCEPAIEVGQSLSGLPAVADERQGPLSAVVAGWSALQAAGAEGDVLVVATDLPFATRELFSALTSYPSGGLSVVPLVRGRLQPLCSRWSRHTLAEAGRLLESGERRAQAAFFDESTFLAVSPLDLGRAEFARELSDFDSPEDLRRLDFGSGPSS